MSVTDSVAEVAWDPFDVPADLYAQYAAMRDRAPVYHNAERDVWALSRYEDVLMANRDWQTFSYAKGTIFDNIGDYLQPGFFLDEDPPLHTQLRAVVKDRFSVKALRDTFSSVIDLEVDALLAQATSSDEFDFGIECAWKLPVVVGCLLLGFPREDIDRLKAITDRAFATVSGPPGSGAASVAAVAATSIREYFEEQIEDRRSHPKDDLLTQIATATVEGKPIGDAAAGMAALIFAASADTSALAMTNVVNLLAEHPDQRKWLVDNPELTEQAIEEALRCESPVQMMKRTTTREVDLHGVTIPAGAIVGLIFGSANRDPRKFDRADQFDVQRKFSRHIAFGDGIHHCLGAPVARIEATTMLRKLLEIVPDYEVVDSWKLEGKMHGFRNLKIRRA